jgi:hypothetical protein
VGFHTAGQCGRSTNVEFDGYFKIGKQRKRWIEYAEGDTRVSFGFTLAELSPSEAGKVNCTSGKAIEAVTEISATTPSSATAFALMLKEGPTDTMPGKLSPGRPTSKIVRSGVCKVPLALAAMLKVAEASPERPPVKAYLNTGQEAGVYRVDGQHTSFSISGGTIEPVTMKPTFAVSLAATSTSIFRPASSAGTLPCWGQLIDSSKMGKF